MPKRLDAKRSSAEKDYEYDWIPFLTAGETITEHLIQMCPNDVTGVTLDTLSHSTTSTFCWLRGGTGGTAEVMHQITTSLGHIEIDTILVDILPDC